MVSSSHKLDVSTAHVAVCGFVPQPAACELYTDAVKFRQKNVDELSRDSSVNACGDLICGSEVDILNRLWPQFWPGGIGLKQPLNAHKGCELSVIICIMLI